MDIPVVEVLGNGPTEDSYTLIQGRVGFTGRQTGYTANFFPDAFAALPGGL